MALAAFQLGHLYQTYQAELGTSARFKQQLKMEKLKARTNKRRSIKSESSPLMFTPDSLNKMCLDYALHYFKKAERMFIKVNHIKGSLITTERLL